MARISATKPSHITVGTHTYKLEPATTRSHYGETRHGSETHYAFRSKKADEAWFVLSKWNDKKIGLLYHWDNSGRAMANSSEWSVQKIQSEQEAPRWLRAQYHDVPATIYIVSATLLTGPTAEAAIARAEGINLPTEDRQRLPHRGHKSVGCAKCGV
jgi:hypothetical protein